MDCKLKAIGNRVIVQVVEKNEKSEGGIILPDNMKVAQKKATVVAIGEGVLLPDGRRTEMRVEVGDTVIINQQFGAEVKVDGETYLIFEHDNILAKF